MYISIKLRTVIRARFLALHSSGISREGHGTVLSVMVFIFFGLSHLRITEPLDYRTFGISGSPPCMRVCSEVFILQ